MSQAESTAATDAARSSPAADAPTGARGPESPGPGQRQHTRFSVPAMYSLLRARSRSETHFCHTGHIYDVSLGGLRFELDEPIEPGTELDIRAMLPGPEHVTFRAKGRVVRLHNTDAEDRGPSRMGLAFDQFKSQADRACVETYVAGRSGEYTPPTRDDQPRTLFAPPASKAA